MSKHVETCGECQRHGMSKQREKPKRQIVFGFAFKTVLDFNGRNLAYQPPLAVSRYPASPSHATITLDEQMKASRFMKRYYMECNSLIPEEWLGSARKFVRESPEDFYNGDDIDLDMISSGFVDRTHIPEFRCNFCGRNVNQQQQVPCT